MSDHPLACMRKKRFPSEAKARSVIFSMRARNQDVERLEPYRCATCQEWHLGRLPLGGFVPTGARPDSETL